MKLKQVFGPVILMAATMFFVVPGQVDAGVIASYLGSQQGVTVRTNTLVQTSFFGTGINASGIAAGGGNDLYLSSNNSLFRYHLNGNLLNSFTFPDSGINYSDVAYGGGNLLATYTGSQQGVTVRNGTSLVQTNTFGTGVDATGIAAGTLNDLFISAGNQLFRYLTDGTLLNSFTFPDPNILYTGVAVGHGNLYAAYDGSHQGVTVRDPVSLVQTSLFNTGFSASGIIAGNDNDVFLSSGNSLYRYRNDGTLLNSFTFPDPNIVYSSVGWTQVPEPGSIAIFGVLCLVAGRRRKQK